MDIFILNLDNFSIDKLEEFADKYKFSWNSELKKQQHYAGLYLLKYAMNFLYGINDFEIDTTEKKPILKNLPYHFSISHSKNIVGITVDTNPVGFDIEYNQTDRNFKNIMNRYNALTKSNNNLEQKKEFYEFWTKLEAKIKLGSKDKENIHYHTGIFENDYTYSIASNFPIKNISEHIVL